MWHITLREGDSLDPALRRRTTKQRPSGAVAGDAPTVPITLLMNWNPAVKK